MIPKAEPRPLSSAKEGKKKGRTKEPKKKEEEDASTERTVVDIINGAYVHTTHTI